MMAGVPVIAGTRVPLWTLVEYLDGGRGLTAFLADHPQVTPAQADRAIVLALKALIERREAVLKLPRDPKAPPASADAGDSETE